MRKTLAWAYAQAMTAAITANNSRPCNCVGPQDGNPVCPCRMSALTKRDGRWVEIIDHGPVSPHTEGEEGK